MFLVKHLNGKIHGVHVRGLISLSVIAAAIMVVNFFYPIIFYVDEANHYVRGPLFLMSIGINMLFFVDSMIIYFVIRKKSGALAFFPIWQFIIPIIVAIFFQTIFYGVSLLWAGAAVAMVGVVSSLQNELIYVDKLTGLYNRFYLDDLKEKIAKKKESEYTIMMLDLNGFKQINDNYGHSVGDEALRHAGKIMQEVVGSKGTVMRYAGDEFVIVLNTHDLAEAEKYARGIHDGFAEFNAVSNKPYKLFTSVGYCVVDFRNSTVEAMMNMVDKLMYKNKSTFYADHPEFERRLR